MTQDRHIARNQRIYELVCQGKTYREAGKAEKVSVARVRQIVAQARRQEKWRAAHEPQAV